MDKCTHEVRKQRWKNIIGQCLQRPEWSSFIKRLYDSILTGKYQRGEIEFKVPLSKVQFLN